MAAQKSGISERPLVEKRMKNPKEVIYTLSTTAYGNFTVPFSYPDVLTNDRLFAIQADVIRKEAAEKTA